MPPWSFFVFLDFITSYYSIMKTFFLVVVSNDLILLNSSAYFSSLSLFYDPCVSDIAKYFDKSVGDEVSVNNHTYYTTHNDWIKTESKPWSSNPMVESYQNEPKTMWFLQDLERKYSSSISVLACIHQSINWFVSSLINVHMYLH